MCFVSDVHMLLWRFSLQFHRCFCVGWSHAQYECGQGVEQIMWVYISMEESHCISACNFATSFFFLLFVFVWKTLLWMECGRQTGALLLDGNTLSYFGANIPVNLAAAVIAEVLLVGGAEYYRSTNKSPLGSVMPFSKTLFPQNFVLCRILFCVSNLWNLVFQITSLNVNDAVECSKAST